MKFCYTNEHEALKFLFHVKCKDVEYECSKTLRLVLDDKLLEDYKSIVEYLFTLYGEEINPKKLKKFSLIPSNPLKDSSDSIFAYYSFICCLRNSLVGGTMKDIEYLRSFPLEVKLDPEFLFLDIKAGYITEIREISEKLYAEKVSFKEETQICSGLRQICEKEELLNKIFLFFKNLKPTKLKGEQSNGMICCASDENNVEPLLVTSDKDTRISLEGYFQIFENLERKNLDIKKKGVKDIFDNFKINDSCLTFKGVKVMCGDSLVRTNKVEKGVVS